MSAASAIRAKLRADTAVVAAVGENISPQYTPGNPFPRIVYEVLDDDTGITHDGPVRLTKAPIIVHCMARALSGIFPYKEARALAALAKHALESKKGDAYRVLWGDTVIQKCFHRGNTERELTPSDTGETGRVVLVSHRFDLWYEEPLEPS